jgi:hypothetical protein
MNNRRPAPAKAAGWQNGADLTVSSNYAVTATITLRMANMGFKF